jgi:hypothetical protein
MKRTIVATALLCLAAVTYSQQNFLKDLIRPHPI